MIGYHNFNMKKLILFCLLFIGCSEDEGETFDNSLPKLNLDKFRVVEAGGGFGMPTTYSLSFSGYIINLTDNVYKTYRQNVVFTAANGNQVTGEMGLQMFRWLCPYDSLYGGGRSDNFENSTFIDSIVSWEAINDGLIVNYGEGDECDKN